MNIETRVMRVSPTRAQKWLEAQKKNRKLSKSLVDRYARDMRADRWQLNGEAIVFNGDGGMLDGQHRCMAVVQSGRTIPFVVVKGVEEESFKTMNSGRARRYGDVLRIQGHQYCAVKTAVLGLLHRWIYSQGGLVTGGASSASNLEMEALHKKHRRIERSIELTCTRAAKTRGRFGGVLARSRAAFCHYVFSRVDPSKADRFMAGLGAGVDLGKSSPILLVRNRLLRDWAQPDYRSRALPELYLVFTAWNAYRRRQNPDRLQLPRGGAKSLPDPGWQPWKRAK